MRSPAVEPEATQPGFDVHLRNFEGPFDLLLSLISKHQLDVTEVALAQVTDEFVAHITASGPVWDLGRTTEFLVVAATLLDLKAARLLPSGEVEDDEDLALLEARDLLFARLLQYRAYKSVAGWFAERLAGESSRHPRVVAMDPRFASLLPEVLLGLGPAEFAWLAARVLAPRPVPTVDVAHVHAAPVSVREQAGILLGMLGTTGSATFRGLTAGCPDTVTVVARFLALLELFREGLVTFEQASPLGELLVRSTGGTLDDAEATALGEEYDAPEQEEEP